MNFREPVNKKCACGSGKKHKNCCGKKSKGFEQQFHASIRASEGTSAEMEILSVSVSDGVMNKQIVSSPVNLSVNSVKGEKTDKASVSLSVPVRGQPIGVVSTSGNATAVAGLTTPSVSIGNGKKKIKEEGKNGLYVTAYVGKQKETGLNFAVHLQKGRITVNEC